ncbi:MAG TPA: hypothetical protein VM580_34885, partial [Labilithrix sp.]|nr:hypothetical protein [Labilithrix sp.]
GGTLRYEKKFAPDLSLSLVGSMSRQAIRLVDISNWSYDWFGHRTAQRVSKGEIYDERNSTIWQTGQFGRGLLEWRARPEHVLRGASTARYGQRTGEEKGKPGPRGIDPLAGERNLLTLVSRPRVRTQCLRHAVVGCATRAPA